MKPKPCNGRHVFRELPPKLARRRVPITLGKGQKVYACSCGTIRIQGTGSEPVKVGEE